MRSFPLTPHRLYVSTKRRKLHTGLWGTEKTERLQTGVLTPVEQDDNVESENKYAETDMQTFLWIETSDATRRLQRLNFNKTHQQKGPTH